MSLLALAAEPGQCGEAKQLRKGHFIVTSGVVRGATVQVWDAVTGFLLRNLRTENVI